MDSTPVCVKFTGKNYSTWAFQFEIFLKGKELWGHIDGTDVAPTSDSDKSQEAVSSPSWAVLDARIMSWLLGSVEPHLITNLRAYCSAQSMWNYLKKNLHKTSQRDQFLMKLRPEYESVRSSLLNRSPVPSLDICFGELLREEQRLSTQAILEQSHDSSKTTTMAYAAQGHGSPVTSKNLQCFCCKEYGHIAANCPKKYCSYCKKKGHIIKECRIRPQNRQAHAFQTSVTIPPAETSVAHDFSSGASSDLAPPAVTYCTPEMVQQMLISALSAMGFQGKHSTTLWYVDSGASNHMTNTPANLSHVRPYAGQSAIQTANGNSLPIAAVGNASSTFTDVFLAPQLSTNLIYVGPGNGEADREGT
ncbi:hypothetical protein Pint_18823 [Pistacia integerrima]|uniref:Uncharacterized protein n=1 Tax=Pistacia integerrima TaxID=434235 RepID=A0ACC0YYW3_9ROSI|nr:hypothetical protein Pint_18823 [Pistacia integerrima]